MIPYSYNMVDMGGIDLVEVNGTVVPGIYEKIYDAVNDCGDVVLYNWKFAGIEITPQYTQILIGDPIIINGVIQVTELDQITIEGVGPEPPELDQLAVTQNGVYTPEPPYVGFDEVEVEVLPTIESLSIIQNGEYTAPEGIDGFSPINVSVPGISENDLLFHFEDFNNSGKMNAAFYDKTGYSISSLKSKFGDKSLLVGSSPSVGGAVYFDSGFTLGNQDFTLDFWMYQTSGISSSNCALSFNYRSFGYYSATPVERGLACARVASSWAVDRGGLTHDLNIANAWHHVAITRSNNIIRIFVDGVLEDSFEWTYSFAPMTRMSFGTNSSDEQGWRGYIDEFRLKIGEAVWTADFTPPTEPYT